MERGRRLGRELWAESSAYVCECVVRAFVGGPNSKLVMSVCSFFEFTMSSPTFHKHLEFACQGVVEGTRSHRASRDIGRGSLPRGPPAHRRRCLGTAGPLPVAVTVGASGPSSGRKFMINICLMPHTPWLAETSSAAALSSRRLRSLGQRGPRRASPRVHADSNSMTIIEDNQREKAETQGENRNIF